MQHLPAQHSLRPFVPVRLLVPPFVSSYFRKPKVQKGPYPPAMEFLAVDAPRLSAAPDFDTLDLPRLQEIAAAMPRRHSWAGFDAKNPESVAAFHKKAMAAQSQEELSGEFYMAIRDTKDKTKDELGILIGGLSVHIINGKARISLFMDPAYQKRDYGIEAVAAINTLLLAADCNRLSALARPADYKTWRDLLGGGLRAGTWLYRADRQKPWRVEREAKAGLRRFSVNLTRVLPKLIERWENEEVKISGKFRWGAWDESRWHDTIREVLVRHLHDTQGMAWFEEMVERSRAAQGEQKGAKDLLAKWPRGKPIRGRVGPFVCHVGL